MAEDIVYKAPSLKGQLVTFTVIKSFLDNLVEGHSHNEDTTGTFTLFSRSWEIPLKADLCFKLFLFSVFSINLFVMTFFSTRLFLLFLVVALCSLSSCSFKATVLSAFSTCHKHKKSTFKSFYIILLLYGLWDHPRNWIMYCTSPPKQARWSYVSLQGLAAVSCKKMVFSTSHSDILTKFVCCRICSASSKTLTASRSHK